jgi:hemerythrin-like metal-binding protein
MALFEWKKEYSVGVQVLDKHHQKLIRIINDVHNAMKEGKAQEAVIRAVDELLDYAKYHFGEEEKLMEKIKYAELETHRNAHRLFIAKAEEYKKQADKGLAAFMSLGVSKFLIDWLINHIGTVDKRYQKEMNAKGIK